MVEFFGGYARFVSANVGQHEDGGRRGFVFPVAHLMGLAPLDVWIRTIRRSGGVRPGYWVRLVGVLFTSLVGTMCSTPERVLVWALRRGRMGGRERFEHAPGVIVITGYYRSGTTHAQNLMSCGPGVVTPRWAQALMGQGWVVSWFIARLLLVPFVGSSRPQDGVGFGPMWAGEDDFALATWGVCSTLPGRLVFPGSWDHWSRFNTLEGCDDRERARFRRTVAGFAWKVTRAKRDRVLVLKTPSHGAHLGELKAVFGDSMRVIHLVREPEAVVASNMRLHHALRQHLLEEPVGVDELRARIVEEYLELERAAKVGLEGLPHTVVAHEDLVADPVGVLGSALDAIGHPMTDEHERAMVRYLGELGAYQRTKHGDAPMGSPTADEGAKLDEIRGMHGHGEPVSRVPIEPVVRERRTVLGVLSAIGIALLFALVWVGLVWVFRQALPGWKPRLDQLVWVGGACIGLGAQRAGIVGSRGLGVLCAALTIGVYLGVSFPITVINWNYGAQYGHEEWVKHNTKGAIEGVIALSSIVFALLGAVTGYKHGSYTGPRAPGT